jgi:hypothetical protein
VSDDDNDGDDDDGDDDDDDGGGDHDHDHDDNSDCPMERKNDDEEIQKMGVRRVLSGGSLPRTSPRESLMRIGEALRAEWWMVLMMMMMMTMRMIVSVLAVVRMLGGPLKLASASSQHAVWKHVRMTLLPGPRGLHLFRLNL